MDDQYLRSFQVDTSQFLEESEFVSAALALDVVAQLFPTHRVPGIVALIRQYTVGDFPWSREMGWRTLDADLPAKDTRFAFAHDRDGGRFFVHLSTTSEIQSLTEDGELLASTAWKICHHLAFDSYRNRLLVQYTNPTTTYVSLEFVDVSNRMEFGAHVSFAASATKNKQATTNCILDANGRLLISLDGRPTIIDADTGSVLCEWENYSTVVRWISCDRDTVLSLELHSWLQLRYFASGIRIAGRFTLLFDDEYPTPTPTSPTSCCIGYDDVTKSAIMTTHYGQTWALDVAGNSRELNSRTHGLHRAVSLADGRLVVLSLVGNTLHAKPLVIPVIPTREASTCCVLSSTCCVL